jgi:hypothetical protein
MKLEQIRIQKKKLSNELLVPSGINYIFGVGIGIHRTCDHVKKKVTGIDGYNIRIYGTENPELKLFEVIRKLFGLNPMLLPLSFPIRLIVENEETLIEFIKAPRPKLATIGGTIETDKCNNFITNDKNIRAGCRVKLGSNGSTGTLGFFCKLKSNPTKTYLLSNSHVIAANGKAKLWLSSIKYFTQNIGKLYRPTAINSKYLINFGIDTSKTPAKYYSHKMDAALAELSSTLIPTSQIIMRNAGTITLSDSYPVDSSTGRTDPTYSYRVTKHGYGSCETGGWIDDVDCDFLMNESGTSNALALFENQFRVVRTITPNSGEIDNNYTFGTNGDSGSIVFDNNDSTAEHKAIGLFFAFGREGDQDFLVKDPNKPKSLTNCYSVVTPISVIENELGIDLFYPLANSTTSS